MLDVITYSALMSASKKGKKPEQEQLAGNADDAASERGRGTEEESEAKRVKIQNDGQELVVNCDIGRPRCLLCRLSSSSDPCGVSSYSTHILQLFQEYVCSMTNSSVYNE